MHEVITRWTTAGSSGGLSIMYMNSASDVALYRAELATLWQTIDNSLTTSTTWTIDTGGRILDEATGTLTGFWSDPTARSGAGALAGSAVSNSSMVLLRWRTEAIVGGRLVQGRTFVPGLGAGLLANGQIAEATRAGMQAAAQAFAVSGDGAVVWHRPKNGAGGSHHFVSSAACWAELAVLRRRRD